VVAVVSASARSDREAATLRIRGVYADISDPYWISLKCGADAAAKALHVDLKMQGPATADVPGEVSTLNSLAVTNPDGMFIAPYSPTAFIAPVTKLMKKGIPVISVDGNLAKKVDYMTVHTSLAHVGQLFAQAMSGAMHGKGTLGIVAFGPGNPYDALRYKSGVARLKKKSPGIKVLPIEYGAAQTAKTAAIVSAMIRSHPDLTAIYTTNGPEAAGAASAILGAHKRGQIALVSFDATPVETAGIRSGTFSALISQAPYLEGQYTVQKLVAYLKKHPNKTPVHPASNYFTPTPLMLLTKKNIDSPLGKKFSYRTSC
jgi:ABC-type sugar transport system substrate-binding protein